MKLTKRETEVRALMVEGKTAQECAAALGIAVGTVNAHRKHLAIKLAQYPKPEEAEVENGA